jgi:hypothetical protein
MKSASAVYDMNSNEMPVVCSLFLVVLHIFLSWKPLYTLLSCNHYINFISHNTFLLYLFMDTHFLSSALPSLSAGAGIVQSA